MPLQCQPILIVDSRISPFVWTLQSVLEQAGAEVMVARHAAKAIEYLDRFSFSACLLGALDDLPKDCCELQRELAGLPTLTYGVISINPVSSLPEDVPAIVRALNGRLA